MTDKLDPQTHRFGMAYMCKLNERYSTLVYPSDNFNISDQTSNVNGHMVAFDRLTRCPDKDLIPRADLMKSLQSAEISTQQLKLHLGEMTAQETRTAKAAYRLGVLSQRDASYQLAEAVRRVIEEGVQETEGPYSSPKNNKCRHGRYGFEGCDQCIEEFLSTALTAYKVSKAGA